MTETVFLAFFEMTENWKKCALDFEGQVRPETFTDMHFSGVLWTFKNDLWLKQEATWLCSVLRNHHKHGRKC